jgi:hypothetical protein
MSSTYQNFARHRALDHLWDLHQCKFNTDMDPKLRSFIADEMTATGWHSEADLAHIGRYAMDKLLDIYGDLVKRK